MELESKPPKPTSISEMNRTHLGNWVIAEVTKREGSTPIEGIVYKTAPDYEGLMGNHGTIAEYLKSLNSFNPDKKFTVFLAREMVTVVDVVTES